MVGGEVVVDRVGEHSIARIEKVYEEEQEEDKEAKLYRSSNLVGRQYSIRWLDEEGLVLLFAVPW